MRLRVGWSIPWFQTFLKPLDFISECCHVPNAKAQSHAMRARRGSRHHLPVVGSGCDRVEGVVGKDNRIETPNHFLQQVSEEGVASSGTGAQESTRFEDRVCSLQEKWCDTSRFRTLHLSRLPTPIRIQKFQHGRAKGSQVSWP